MTLNHMLEELNEIEIQLESLKRRRSYLRSQLQQLKQESQDALYELVKTIKRHELFKKLLSFGAHKVLFETELEKDRIRVSFVDRNEDRTTFFIKSESDIDPSLKIFLNLAIKDAFLMNLNENFAKELVDHSSNSFNIQGYLNNRIQHVSVKHAILSFEIQKDSIDDSQDFVEIKLSATCSDGDNDFVINRTLTTCSLFGLSIISKKVLTQAALSFNISK